MVRCITAFCLLSSLVSAQWSVQHPSPTSNLILDLQSPKPSVLYAVGLGSTMVRTTNGGASWTSGKTKVGGIFYAIQMFDSLKGWMTGSSPTYAGYVHRTTDGGLTWDTVGTRQTSVYGDLQFFDALNGYMAGGFTNKAYLVSTSDGGGSWTNIAVPLTAPINRIFFLSMNHGWVGAQNGAMLRTSDSGAHWTPLTTGVTASIDGLFFCDTLTGYFVSQQKIYRTVNGGATWTPLTLPNFATVSSIHVRDSLRLTVFGSGIYKTWNGGKSWATVSASSGTSLVSMVDTLSGWNVGGSYLFAQTTNGGTVWSEKGVRLSNGEAVDVQFVSKDTGFVATQNECLRTVDGGQQWSKVNTFPSFTLHQMHFVNGTHGWVVGNPQGGVNVGYRTTNGGITWTPFATGYARTHYGVSFVDPNNGWAVSDSGAVLSTTNGGATWTRSSIATTRSLAKIAMTGLQTGVVMDDKGGLYNTENGGTTWTNRVVSGVSSSSSLFMLDALTGWATLNNPTVLKTTDGGATWKSKTIGFENLKDIMFVNASTGYACNTNKKMYLSNDSGNTWMDIASPGTVNALWFVSPSSGYAVGSSGLIAYTTTGGGLMSLHLRSSVEPAQFSLHQNYPNPFNPSTTIRYRLAASASVTLTVYDALGRVVDKLVDGRQGAGEHRATFDAGARASGVYYYRLTVDGRTEVRKMMLMK